MSLVDVSTILKTVGIKQQKKPGTSLVDLAKAEDDPKRLVFSEYHAKGAATGAFMVRKGQWKFVYYVKMQPQLFDLANDPDELNDLGADPQYAKLRKRMEADLRSICDPEKVDLLAKRDQTEIVNANGGIDAVIAKGSFGAFLTRCKREYTSKSDW